MEVLLGKGDGTFQTAISYSSGGSDTESLAVAEFNGDGQPDVAVANLASNTVGVLINTSRVGTTTALVSSPNPSRFGQVVTFTVTVKAQPGVSKETPTGMVKFLDGATSLGSAALNSNGIAVLTTSVLAVGSHSITASYGGSATFACSRSPALKQVAQGAIASVSPTSLNFGNQTVGFTSAARTGTLMNKANVALSISSITVTGINLGDFAQTNNCHGSVAMNGSCTISVTFRPSTTGSRTATLNIADNAPGSPQRVSLSGIGVLPAVKFSPTSLVFPTQLIYANSKTQTAKLTNSGPGILKITKVAVTGQFTQTNNCGATLNSGSSCTVTVVFKPTAIGNLSGSIAITDNAPGSPQSLTLKGTATAVELAPTTINYGNQPKGTASLPKTITLTNQSHATANFTGITITGADPGDFSETNTCGKSVASAASCFIKVVFKPTATGSRSASVSISDDGGGSPQKVALVGNGT